MKVYDFKAFPNPARVRIALAEKGLYSDVEFINVDVPAGEHKNPAYLAINPAAVVPALELDDGTILTECTAITEYLDHLEGEPTLTGLSAKERGTIHMLQRKIETGLLDAVATYFHHATPGLGPDIEEYQNKEWGEKKREDAIKTLHWIEGLLQNRDYIAGDRLTVADITAFAGLAFADFIELAIPDSCPKVKTWRERVASRPSMAVLAA